MRTIRRILKPTVAPLIRRAGPSSGYRPAPHLTFGCTLGLLPIVGNVVLRPIRYSLVLDGANFAIDARRRDDRMNGTMSAYGTSRHFAVLRNLVAIGA